MHGPRVPEIERPYKEIVMKRLALAIAVLAIAACTTKEAANDTAMVPTPSTTDTARADSADTTRADSLRDSATKRP